MSKSEYNFIKIRQIVNWKFSIIILSADINLIIFISFLPIFAEAIDFLAKFDIMKIDLRNLKQFLPFFNAFEVFYTIRRHPLTMFAPIEGEGQKR